MAEIPLSYSLCFVILHEICSQIPWVTGGGEMHFSKLKSFAVFVLPFWNRMIKQCFQWASLLQGPRPITIMLEHRQGGAVIGDSPMKLWWLHTLRKDHDQHYFRVGIFKIRLIHYHTWKKSFGLEKCVPLYTFKTVTNVSWIHYIDDVWSVCRCPELRGSTIALTVMWR